MHLWISSSLFPRDRHVHGELGMPCVVGVVFDAPQNAAVQGAPITCGQCGAALNDPAAVQRIKGVGPGFQCGFCGAVVVLREAPPGAFEFEVEKPKPHTGLGPHVLGVIDVSGSMAEGSLGAVVQSLRTTLEDLAANAPDTRFGLVTFGSHVTIYGAPTDEAPIVTAALESFEVMANEAAIIAWATQIPLEATPVRTSADGWRRAIEQLSASGTTALGPALVAAAAKIPDGVSGRLILLTDGWANKGIGALNGPSVSGRLFYDELAHRLTRAGIVVDVVGVAGEGSIELARLRVLADATGGDLFYVDRSEVAGAFKAIRGARIVARRAKLRIVLPAGVRATSASGCPLGGKLAQGEEVLIGSVAEQREVFFAIEPDQAITQPIPVQVQLRYWDDLGAGRLEVRNAWLTPSEDPEAIKRQYDLGPYTMMEVQRGGEEAVERGLEHAQARLQALARKLGDTPGWAYKQKVDDELRRVTSELEKRGRASYADSAGAASYAMMKRTSKFYTST